MKKLKFGLGQLRTHAPLWMQNLLAILVLLMSAQGFLIDNLPGVSDEVKQAAHGWFEYVSDAVQVVIAIAVIFIGKDRNSKPDTDTPFK